MPRYLESKLCRQAEPERGCLARCKTIAPPKNSCPMLSLPPEVRAQIFEYLICSEPLRFTLKGRGKSVPYRQVLPNYRNNLAFLEACRLFKVEALALVRVRSIGLDAIHRNKTDSSIVDLRNDRVLPTTIALSLGHVKAFVEAVTISSNYALETALNRGILRDLPKLKTITIQQDMHTRPFSKEFPRSLEVNATGARRELIMTSLDNRTCCSWCPLSMDEERSPTNRKKLSRLLERPDYPSNVQSLIMTTLRPWKNRYADVLEEDTSYPIKGAVSAIRATYNWPEKALSALEVEYYNQPMVLAVKSKWTHRIPLDQQPPIKQKGG